MISSENWNLPPQNQVGSSDFSDLKNATIEVKKQLGFSSDWTAEEMTNEVVVK